MLKSIGGYSKRLVVGVGPEDRHAAILGIEVLEKATGKPSSSRNALGGMRSRIRKRLRVADEAP